MGYGRLKDYLGKGPLIDRPATPNLPVGQSAYWLDTDTTTISHWNGSAWEDPDFTGPGSIPEAPIDGKLYGRKDAAWEEIVGGGGVPRPYIKDAIASYDTTNLVDTSTVAAKGIIFSPNVNMTIHAIGIYIAPDLSIPSTVMNRLVKIDNSGLILEVLGDTAIKSIPAMSTAEKMNLMEFLTPIPVLKDDRLAVLSIRTDGTGTAPMGVSYRSLSITTRNYSTTHLGSVTIANNNPTVGDTLTVGTRNFLGRILFEDKD